MTHHRRYEFAHGASTEEGSSGSPIFLKGTTKVIAIHKGGNDIDNYGDFIWPIFNYFNNFSNNKIELNEKKDINALNNANLNNNINLGKEKNNSEILIPEEELNFTKVRINH